MGGLECWPVRWRDLLGVSILELLVATAVIILGLFGLASVYTFGTLAGKASEESLAAHRYACRLVDLIRAENKPFESGFPPSWTEELEPGLAAEKEVPLDAPPFTGVLPADTGLVRQVRLRWLGHRSSDYRQRLVEVTVKVGWAVEGRTRWVEAVALHRRP